MDPNCPTPFDLGGTPGTNNCYSSTPTDNCGSVDGFGVSDEEKSIIVDAHNRLRTNVATGQETQGNPGPQPSASNMRRMVWDDGLAATAQGLANTCNFAHDDPNCRTFASSFGSAGQNLYWSSGYEGTQADWNSAVQAWYDEVGQYDCNAVNPFQFTEATGHYTQVVWADSYAVGCGYVAYGGGSKLYACNYGPAGNVMGLGMYGVGTPCTCCQSTCSDGVLCD
ncbi:unnamed protein product [Darwinula stevensoni]|uniref:SCP domain-containing protein n=1 Tax=Darwinula stevensoni TaxID=69355 RepID=A0A7R9A402_9CRUS|nr:unnamed protein product [Darwinula stevensoni]CAG0883242.1 unnamed protein product [Darwinula stevensoni]